MNIHCRSQTAILMIIGCLVFTTGVSAEDTPYSKIDSPVRTSPVPVHLFLTGPNLPVNGAALNAITARADEGHFTEVSVDTNDHWEYPGATIAFGGRLDAGTYTVWVVNRPNDRSQLAKADYTTISVRLGTPVIKVNSPKIPGTLVLNTLPDGASVLIDDMYRGSTPLTIVRINPGTYGVTFSRFGFAKLSTPVRVESGKKTEVSGEFIPLTGSFYITTRPPGAWILLDTINLGVTPITLPNLTVGNHSLTIGKEGYVTAEQRVIVVVDRTTENTISLVPASLPLVDVKRRAGPAPSPLIADFITILQVMRYLRRE